MGTGHGQHGNARVFGAAGQRHKALLHAQRGVPTAHNEQIALWAAEQTAHRLQGAAAQATGTTGRLCLHRGTHAQPCRHASQHAQRPPASNNKPITFHHGMKPNQ